MQTTNSSANKLIDVLADASDLTVVFETSTGVRFTLDPENTGYVHNGYLVIPIMDDETA